MAQSKQSKWHHVCPSWILGPRKSHPKFGGAIVLDGIASVEERLILLHRRFPDDLSSGHIWHEVQAGKPYRRFNSRHAISFTKLCYGIADGKYPGWSAFTSPAFGLPRVHNGAILSDKSDVVEMADYGHRLAIKFAEYTKKVCCGGGHVIWWPAWDSRRHQRGPGDQQLSVDEATERFIRFWAPILRDTDATVCLEYKPSVPGDLDYMPTMQAAVRFCKLINKQVGRTAMVINLEWAHCLIGGQDVAEATYRQIQAGMFNGLVHVNSAEKAIVQWDNAGVNIVNGTPGDDKDWAVGEGGQKRWDDQQMAVAMLDALGVEIYAEHDIDPAGEDPFECYGRSRGNLEQMIANVRQNKTTA